MSKKQPQGFQGVRHAYARGEFTLAPTHEFAKLANERDRDHAMAQGPIAHFLQHTRQSSVQTSPRSHGAGSFTEVTDERRDRKEDRVGTTAAGATSAIAGQGAERKTSPVKSTAGATSAATSSTPKPVTPKTTQTAKPTKKHGVRGAQGILNREIRKEAGPIVIGSSSSSSSSDSSPSPRPKPSFTGRRAKKMEEERKAGPVTAPKSMAAASASAASSSMQAGKSVIKAGDTIKSSAGTSASSAARKPAAAKTAPVRPSSSTASGGSKGADRARGRLKSAAASSSATATSSNRAQERTGNTSMAKTKTRFEDLPDAKPKRTAMAKRPTSVRHSMWDPDEDDEDCSTKKKKRKR